MLTIQIVSILVSGLIAYYTSRRGRRWMTVPALMLGMMGGWVVGLTFAVIWAEGNADSMERGLSATFWFSLIGSIAGSWFGRSRGSRQSLASVHSGRNADTNDSVDNPEEQTNDNSVKVAQLEAKLGKYKSDTLSKAREVCKEDFSRIDDIYVAYRAKELKKTTFDVKGENSSKDFSSQHLRDRFFKRMSPGGWLAYAIVTAVVGALVIYHADHIKESSLDFASTPTRETCIDKYASPAKTDIAARILILSCNREFVHNEPPDEFHYCLRNGTLASFTTDRAAKERIVECYDL